MLVLPRRSRRARCCTGSRAGPRITPVSWSWSTCKRALLRPRLPADRAHAALRVEHPLVVLERHPVLALEVTVAVGRLAFRPLPRTRAALPVVAARGFACCHRLNAVAMSACGSSAVRALLRREVARPCNRSDSRRPCRRLGRTRRAASISPQTLQRFTRAIVRRRCDSYARLYVTLTVRPSARSYVTNSSALSSSTESISSSRSSMSSFNFSPRSDERGDLFGDDFLALLGSGFLLAFSFGHDRILLRHLQLAVSRSTSWRGVDT